MVARRRRKKRHALNPLKYLTPEVWANLTKIIAGGAVVATPAMMVKQRGDEQIESAEIKVQYANANTNAALSALATLTYRLDSLAGEVAVLKAQQRRLIRKSPEAMVGPEIPATWLPQPPKKSFWDRLRGR